MSNTGENYVGHRILEAMHEAVLYSETVFQKLRSAMPSGAKAILDFGAGDGLFVGKLSAQGIKADCVEPDPHLKDRLRDRAATVFSDVHDAPDAGYDFVYTINVLEHIEALDETCAQLFRVTVPSGRLFVFVPAFEILWTALDDEVGHVRRFTRKSLKTALERSGFSVERIEYFDSIGFPAALAVRVLERLGLFRYSGGTVGFYDHYIFPLSRSLDSVTSCVFGKNLIAVARKPA
jgi:SAM-dependent methyltransferase